MRTIVTFFGLLTLAMAWAPSTAAAVTRYVAPNGTDTDLCGGGRSVLLLHHRHHQGRLARVLPRRRGHDHRRGADRLVAVRIQAANVTFGSLGSGFTVRGGLIGILVDAPRSRIEGNDVFIDNEDVIFGNFGTQVLGNTFRGNTGMGIFAVDGSVIAGNVFAQNGGAIQFSGADQRVTDNIITGNSVDGIQITRTASGVIRRNILSMNGGSGIVIGASSAGAYAGLVITTQNTAGR